MESGDAPSEWLNYHHLRYFHAVAQEGSVSRAASKLNVSQSALCAQVKQLEEALGDSLYRRSGRTIVLTDFGRMIEGYADEIFALGREILSTARHLPDNRTLRLHVGIVDSFPKLLTLDILRPVFSRSEIRVTCREGKMDDLLGQLVAHRLDVLLADEPPPSGVQVRVFDHPIGSSGISFCVDPQLRRQLSRQFPQNLNGAPILMPASGSTLRREVEKWFRSVGVEPQVVAEFEDAALAKIVATEGVGITLVPTIVESEAIERYGFTVLGRARTCQLQLHLITADRRIEHPGVALLARNLSKPTRRSGGRRRALSP